MGLSLLRVSSTKPVESIQKSAPKRKFPARVLDPHLDRNRPHQREIFRMGRDRDSYLVFNVILPPSEFYDRNPFQHLLKNHQRRQ
jgi:hypothetical protein